MGVFCQAERSDFLEACERYRCIVHLHGKPAVNLVCWNLLSLNSCKVTVQYGLKRIVGASWFVIADFPPSAKRKLQKHNPFVAMALSARTTLRSGVFMQVADFIFCTTMDAYRFAPLCLLTPHTKTSMSQTQEGCGLCLFNTCSPDTHCVRMSLLQVCVCAL